MYICFYLSHSTVEHLKQTIGQLIRDARIEKNLTQKELGAKIGVSESAVARYESGTLNMSTEVLFKIANAMDMDLQIKMKNR